MSPEVAPGNWLPVGRVEHFRLVLRLYDTPLTTGSRIADLAMPDIRKVALLMRRTILFIIGGILLGGIIHIAIVFMVPYYADHDAWAEMHRFGRDGQFHVLPVPEAGAEPLASLDPRMVQAVCRFSLGAGRCASLRPSPTSSGRWPCSTGAAATSTA